MKTSSVLRLKSLNKIIMEESHSSGFKDPNGEGEPGIVKTVPVIRDFKLNPSCDHGPTILFERDGKRFFSCSAYRSKKLCPFFMTEEVWNRKRAKDGNGLDVDRPGNVEVGVGNKEAGKKEEKAKNPLVSPTQRDKGEAQYHFNIKTVQFFMTQLRNLKFDSVLCIGTPSLHQEIQKLHQNHNESPGTINSFLLDLDQRFAKLHKKGFALYNMCNHNFFESREGYEEFLKSSQKKLAIVVDPPFGVKVELIWHGCLSGVREDLKGLNPNCQLEMFWIFPYFMEGHILSKCEDSGFQMSDFHVEYSNHTKYSGGARTKSSPIRIFTTVPLSDLALSGEEYRFCDSCRKWVDLRNKHCDLCATCTTKDGGPTYIHCSTCQKCVKPTWSHCASCRSCHLADSNSCSKTKDLRNFPKNEKPNLKRNYGAAVAVASRNNIDKWKGASKSKKRKRNKRNM